MLGLQGPLHREWLQKSRQCHLRPLAAAWSGFAEDHPSRSATPDDCAEAVLALLRNKYTSGEIFVVDGGLTQRM